MSECNQIAKEFKVNTIGTDQADRINEIRLTATRFLEVINRDTKPSREQSLAKTKLEECVMWANKSISLEEVNNG